LSQVIGVTRTRPPVPTHGVNSIQTAKTIAAALDCVVVVKMNENDQQGGEKGRHVVCDRSTVLQVKGCDLEVPTSPINNFKHDLSCVSILDPGVQIE
jgi:hypothetical protein